jgi:hypothetical protein
MERTKSPSSTRCSSQRACNDTRAQSNRRAIGCPQCFRALRLTFGYPILARLAEGCPWRWAGDTAACTTSVCVIVITVRLHRHGSRGAWVSLVPPTLASSSTRASTIVLPDPHGLHSKTLGVMLHHRLASLRRVSLPARETCGATNLWLPYLPWGPERCTTSTSTSGCDGWTCLGPGVNWDRRGVSPTRPV